MLKEMPEDRQITVTASEDDEGTRLDAYIGYNTDELSRSYAVRLIGNGNVSVNGRIVTSKKHRIMPGDTVTIILPEPEMLSVTAENIPLDIVYEDEDVLVVDKPRGMVVHPGPGNWSGTLVNAVMYHCGDSLSSINGVIRPGIVHRIDKDTSGLLMIARNNRAHESLAEQLKQHTVTREYTALCHDNIPEEPNWKISGVTCDHSASFDRNAALRPGGELHPAGVITIDIPIGRDENNRMRRAVRGCGSREAVTHITVLERFGRYTLIKARLETGRTHQIRVHMAYIHHPLVGDELYGPRRAGNDIAGVKVTGQLLHAGTLGFIHPSSGEYMEFHSDLPDVFSKVLHELRKQSMQQHR